MHPQDAERYQSLSMFIFRNFNRAVHSEFEGLLKRLALAACFRLRPGTAARKCENRAAVASELVIFGCTTQISFI